MTPHEHRALIDLGVIAPLPHPRPPTADEHQFAAEHDCRAIARAVVERIMGRDGESRALEALRLKYRQAEAA